MTPCFNFNVFQIPPGAMDIPVRKAYISRHVHQLPLIHIVDEDEIILLNSNENEWYNILYSFPWRDYRNFGAEYYNALYQFNINAMEKREEKVHATKENNGESKKEAKERLLFDRPTMKKTEGKKTPIIFQGEIIESKVQEIKPEDIAPGLVPIRFSGKKPKCFFSLFKSFLGVTLMGFPAEPEMVYKTLTTNPSFARVCGFVPNGVKDEYSAKDVPSLRKLQQFDEIMRDFGLWDKIKWNEVRRNIEEGIIKKENEMVGDTTHYIAFSGFETVKFIDEQGKKQKKSQSKLTKRCRCEDQNTCQHPWELADDGAGTIVKSNSKMFWGHKASILGLPQQGIPLDAVAISDASTFDGETLFPHVERLFENLSEVKPWIDTVLYDSACDSKELKVTFKDKWDIALKTSLNPRRKKDITENLPRGIEKVTPYGVPICTAGYEMEYKGIRYDNEKFIYQSPNTDDGTSVCLSCSHRIDCCPNSVTTRTVNIPFDVLPHIDKNDPPMAKRFKAIMTRRPSVERMIKRLKCDLADPRLSKRGNYSFQAYLDKTMIAYHILLRY